MAEFVAEGPDAGHHAVGVQFRRAGVACELHSVQQDIPVARVALHVPPVWPDRLRVGRLGLVVSRVEHEDVADHAVVGELREVDFVVGQTACLDDQFRGVVRPVRSGVVGRLAGGAVGARDDEFRVEASVGVVVVVVPCAARGAVYAVIVLHEQVVEVLLRAARYERSVGKLHEQDQRPELSDGRRGGDSARCGGFALGGGRFVRGGRGLQAGGAFHRAHVGRFEPGTQFGDEGAFSGRKRTDRSGLYLRGNEPPLGVARGVVKIAVRAARERVALFGEEIVVTLVADDADEQLRAVALGDAHRAGVGRYAPDRSAAERQRRKHQYEWENVALHGMSLRVSDCPGGPDHAYKGNSLILKKQTDRADRFAVSFRRMRAGGPDGSLGVPGASISPAAKVSCSA